LLPACIGFDRTHACVRFYASKFAHAALSESLIVEKPGQMRTSLLASVLVTLLAANGARVIFPDYDPTNSR